MKCKHETKACYGVALSNVAFASCEGEKVKCYMNFLRPENIFLLNLWQDPRPTRDFSHLLSDEFYQGKQFENQTCEKVDFENARSSSKILFCAGGGIGVALSNVAFASCEREKVKCCMNFLRPENIFLLNLWQDLGPTRDFSHLLSDEFYQGKQFENQTCEKVDFENARSSSKILFCAGGGIGVALSNVAFASCEREKVK